MVKKVCDVLSWVLIGGIALLVLLLYGSKLFGIEPYTVLSGSMEPNYHTGSLVYVKAVAAEEIREGDVITFVFSSSSVATHRVIEVDADARCFTTKGDANEVSDSPISFDDLIGKVVFTLPYLGYVAAWLSTVTGKFVLIGLFAVALLLTLICELVSRRNRCDTES